MAHPSSDQTCYVEVHNFYVPMTSNRAPDHTCYVEVHNFYVLMTSKYHVDDINQ